MKIIQNPYRAVGFDGAKSAIPTDSEAVFKLLRHCPVYTESPLTQESNLATYLNVCDLYCKDERTRMGLGSFKALGAAYVIAKQAYDKIGDDVFDIEKAKTALSGITFVSSSAGNHGLSIAAGANIFGAKAVIYLSHQVPEAFAKLLQAKNAETVIQGDDYEASMEAAIKAAEENGWVLLSDSTWEGYEMGREVMQGYTAMASEIVKQMPSHPTHVFLQAGVGGLAAAVAAYLRKSWGDGFKIIIVEPTKAPALQEAIIAGKVITSKSQEESNTSNMGRLDCKEASVYALLALSADADLFMTISDEACTAEIKTLEAHDLSTSPSGGAGFAAAKIICQDEKLRNQFAINEDSKILCILSEAVPNA